MRPSGEPYDPAAQILVAASMRRTFGSKASVSMPRASTPVTRAPRLSSTPSRSRSRRARRCSAPGEGAHADGVDGEPARVEIDRTHVAEQHARVALAPQDVADGGRDVSLGEDAGGDLVQQRLEQVMVRSVDDRHVDVGPPQGLGHKQAAEARADDDDAVPRGGRW